MVDHQSVEIELRNARRARINAELACCDIEQLAAEMRQSHPIIARDWRRKPTADAPSTCGYANFRPGIGFQALTEWVAAKVA
jgi:hypothetical protein